MPPWAQWGGGRSSSVEDGRRCLVFSLVASANAGSATVGYLKRDFDYS